MKLVAIAIISALVCLTLPLKAYAKNEKAGAVLFPAYSFFVNLNSHNYKNAWSFLTKSSHIAIINEIENSFAKNNIKNISGQKISNSMKNGGFISKSYWRGFLKSFNPKMVIKYSVWTIKSIGAKTAQIEINYKYGKAPTFLKMYKEDGKWKFGLYETFYGRMIMGKIVSGVISKF